MKISQHPPLHHPLCPLPPFLPSTSFLNSRFVAKFSIIVLFSFMAPPTHQTRWRAQIEDAFSLFDGDGNGEIDSHEMDEVRSMSRWRLGWQRSECASKAAPNH